MSVSYKVIGRHIQEARKQAKLTQRAVAEKLNMSDTYYGKIERVNLERLAQISVLLHTPLEDLISGCMEQSEPADMENPKKLGLAAQFSEIAYGCSERSRKLMLRVCRDIAQMDRE